MPEEQLRINEIFYALQGESTHAGRPCVFVRLTGCPLRCNYCDTEYAFHEGELLTLEQVWTRVAVHPARLVEVTGGEPLAQANAIPLMQMLIDRGCEVLLETSGALSLAEVPSGVLKIVDFKTPDSKMMHKNDYANLEHIRPGDEVKFVIQSRRDYEWSRDFVHEHALHKKNTVLFSPESSCSIRQDLARWMLEDAVPARFQLQLHKILWPQVERGV